LQIQVTIIIETPEDPLSYGMYTLELTNNFEKKWHTGISIHLLGESYTPTVFDTANYTDTGGPIQAAINDWEDNGKNKTDPVPDYESGAIILIRPVDADPNTNPEGAHLENLIMSRPAKLQGIGPGGDNPVFSETQGTHVSGGGFGNGILCTGTDLFCDALARDAWIVRAEDKAQEMEGGIVNNALVEGQVLYVLGGKKQYEEDIDWNNEALTGGIDGCRISGGHQSNPGIVGPFDAVNPEVRSVQGGGIMLHSYTNFFRITNNAIIGNSGSYAGAIRVGTPFLNQTHGSGDSFNTHLTISGNQIRYNGGFNLAGGKFLGFVVCLSGSPCSNPC
jgi:hypothetical protein